MWPRTVSPVSNEGKVSLSCQESDNGPCNTAQQGGGDHLRICNYCAVPWPYFQTDILEPAGADRVRARFLVSNRCRVAVRVMGGLRMDGSEIEQRGPIDVLALQDAPGDRGQATAPVAGRASMPSFVVPANGRMEVDALIMLDGAVTPSEVAVAVAPKGFGWAYTRGGSLRVEYVIPDGVTEWCAHYEDRRCGEY